MSFFLIDYLCKPRWKFQTGQTENTSSSSKYLFPLQLFTERHQRELLIIFSIIKSLSFVISRSKSLSVVKFFTHDIFLSLLLVDFNL